MTDFIPDFLIAGPAASVQLWPRAAARLSALSCAALEEGSASPCEVCSKPGWCAVVANTTRMRVLPISSADGFRAREGDALFLFTPSKNSLRGKETETAFLRRQLVELASLLGSDVKLFESHAATTGRRWLPL